MNGNPFLAQLVEQSPYGVAVLDREMRYLFCNAKWCLDNGLAKSPVGKCISGV